MSDYTPTTEEIEIAVGPDGATAIRPDDFYRWLAQHDAEVRAQALVEAANLLRPEHPDAAQALNRRAARIRGGDEA